MRREESSATGTSNADWVARVDRRLADFLDRRPLPENLAEAVRYALLGPGKRVRPILTLRSCEAVGGNPEDALVPAAAIEMIHAFSLVHDDLPAVDDDDMRRGRPSLHRHTSEAMAILAGDALIGLALEMVLDGQAPRDRASEIARELVSGCNGMIAGQVYDTLPVPGETADPLQRLEQIHRHKTGALIRAGCRAGAICGGADQDALQSVTRFAEAIGLMFQVVDDLMDVTQTSEHLGKTAGKDKAHRRLTYPAVLGIEGTRGEVERLRDLAMDAIGPLGDDARSLSELIDYLAMRTR